MTKIDLSGYSRAELRKLIADAQAELTRQDEQARERLREKLQAEAEAEGFTVAELFSAPGAVTQTAPKAAKADRGAVAPKYRNPDDPAETWTGRGRQPRWVKVQLEAGRSLDAFLIK
jgi:DNA-binding protein H-NS